MTIKATLKQLQAGTVGIGALMKEGTVLPMKAKYAVSRLADRVQDELEKYGKVRDKHFRDRGCTTEKKLVPNPNAGKPGQDDHIEVEQYVHADGPDELEKIRKEADEMMDAVVELSCHPLNIEQFGDASIDGPAFLGMSWAFKDDQPAEPAKAE